MKGNEIYCFVFFFFFLRYPDVTFVVTFKRVESTLRKLRNNVVPPIPHSLDEMAETMINPQWLSQFTIPTPDGPVNFFQRRIGEGATKSLVFSSPIVTNIARESRRTAFDATYYAVPNGIGASQLFAAMTMFAGIVSIVYSLIKDIMCIEFLIFF